jgi:hypothetical protein
MSKLIIKASELQKQSILGGNIDIDKLKPSVFAAQKIHIKPLLGEELYNKICDDYPDNLTGIYLEMYEEYIKNMLIYSSAAIYLASGGAYQISNAGVLKPTLDNGDSITKNEIDYLYNFNYQLYDSLRQEFIKWIKDKDVPEYVKPCGSNNQRLFGGWYLRKKK